MAQPAEIIGKRDPRSWEKQTWWQLSNGWVAVEGYNVSYGSYITSLTSPDDKTWLASNGEPGIGIGGAERANHVFSTDRYVDLPDFAAAWKDHLRLVRPNFPKTY